ncbi:MAG: 3-isopropylmalate dehydratase large subunit [Bacteroidetes bacterium]|nr:3-isopropylmalate dehydratase large subunit [Bacteroidota bacterium]MCL5034160.1 3-isopropylmalate dehydratase large subunit [Bacteroidota bacterium]
MGMTITEKILAKHAGRDRVTPGENVWVDVDILLTHDVTGPGTISIFKKEFGEKAKIWDNDKVVVIPDHYIFTEDQHAKRNVEFLRSFAHEQDIENFYDVGTPRYKGVCHVALPEEGFARPGEVLFGTDSHTCTAGAFGEFATGIGNTDAAFILGTGKLWVKIPSTARFVFDGEMPDYLMAKDLILKIIGDIGVDGASYQAMEFAGDAVQSLNIEERMTLCNMVIEAGGKNGVIAPDDRTVEYVKARSRKAFTPVQNDTDAVFASERKYDASKLRPMVAKPHSPENAEPAENLSDVKVDQVYIGSCTGGKLTDFIAAARILNGRKTAVDTFIVPATTDVAKGLLEKKIDGKPLRTIFEEAGCRIGNATCGACLGGPDDTFGRLNGEEICVSTTNRNFPGRMGSKKSQVFLASPLTAAATAVTGKITDPRKYLA